jgi:hypothetical protein
VKHIELERDGDVLRAIIDRSGDNLNRVDGKQLVWDLLDVHLPIVCAGSWPATAGPRPDKDEIRAACDIPDRYEVVALLPLGHPRGRWGVAARRPAESLTSWDRFGDRRR